MGSRPGRPARTRRCGLTPRHPPDQSPGLEVQLYRRRVPADRRILEEALGSTLLYFLRQVLEPQPRLLAGHRIKDRFSGRPSYISLDIRVPLPLRIRVQRVYSLLLSALGKFLRLQGRNVAPVELRILYNREANLLVPAANLVLRLAVRLRRICPVRGSESRGGFG